MFFSARFVLACALVLPLPACAAPNVQKLALRPCHVEWTDESVRCGTYPVWENRETKRGRKIDLNVVVLPALGHGRAPDPVFYLAGGPGEGATTADWVGRLTELRQRRDVVLVDQRGTGRSNPLPCDLYGHPPDLAKAVGELYIPAEVRRCRDQLAKVADLTLYTTAIGMDDVDEVRAALGFDQIDLFGGSYGTRAAQVYLRRHGEHVRSVVLDGVAPVDEILPLHHAHAGQRAIGLLFAECAADAACHAAFPHPAEELRAVFERIDRGVTVPVVDRRTGRTVLVRPNRGLVAEGIRFFLYGGQDEANTLPLQIHRAYQGDLAPLVETAIEQRLDVERVLAMGMLFSVLCAEDLPFIDPATAVRETRGTLLGDYRIVQQKRVCADWPRGAVPPDLHTPVRSAVPVLLLSGERDPVTPPELGERVARTLPNSLHLVLPHGAHGSVVASRCLARVVSDFLDRASVHGLDTACVARFPAPRFATGAGELAARGR